MSVTPNHKPYSFLASFVKGETLMGAYTIPTKALSALSGLLIITQLSVFSYGVYVLVLAFYAILYQICFRLLGDVVLNDVIRFIADKKYSEAKRLFIDAMLVRAGIALVLFAGLFLGADVVAALYDKDIGLLFRILSFLLLIDVVRIIVMTLFRIELRFDLVASRHLHLQVFRFVFLIAGFLLLPFSVQLVITMYVVASFFALITLIPAFMDLAQPWFRVKQAALSSLPRILLTYGKWSLVSQTLASTTGNIQPWLIKLFINTEAVAIYSIAENLFGLLKLALPTATLASLIPREIGNKARATAILLRGTKFSFMFRVIVAALGFVAVPILVRILFPHYSEAIPIFQLLVVALPLLAFSHLAKTFINALRRQRYLFVVETVSIVAGLGFTVVFLNFFGLWGMVYERIVMAVLLAMLTLGYLLRYEVPRHEWRTLYTFDRTDLDLLKRILLQLRAYLDAARKRFLRI